MRRILDATHENTDLSKVMTEQCQHQNIKKRDQLISLLGKYEDIFIGTLGTWNITPVDLELREDAKPLFWRHYPEPRVHKSMFIKEVERLVRLGVLEEANDFGWDAYLFAQPKSKTNHVRFIIDFWNLNRQLKREPYPMQKIREMLLSLEVFECASSLDLNMGYYHTRLSKQANNLCTTILPWGKYRYKRLLLGVSNYPDIFQDKMSEIFRGFEFIRAYIDELLIITKVDWPDNLEKLE